MPTQAKKKTWANFTLIQDKVWENVRGLEKWSVAVKAVYCIIQPSTYETCMNAHAVASLCDTFAVKYCVRSESWKIMIPIYV